MRKNNLNKVYNHFLYSIRCKQMKEKRCLPHPNESNRDNYRAADRRSPNNSFNQIWLANRLQVLCILIAFNGRKIHLCRLNFELAAHSAKPLILFTQSKPYSFALQSHLIDKGHNCVHSGMIRIIPDMESNKIQIVDTQFLNLDPFLCK